MHIRSLVGLLLAVSATVGASHAGAAVVFGPTPYLSSAGIPAGFYAGGSPLVLENFEGNSLHPSLAASQGAIIGFAGYGTLVDSVDADDGVIDGNATSADPGSTAAATRESPSPMSAAGPCRPRSASSGPMAEGTSRFRRSTATT